MRKRVTIGMLLLLGLVAALLVLPELFSTEPKYQGKRLSVWFKQYYRTGAFSPRADPVDHEEAERALKAIGSNGVPWLVSHCFDIKPNSARQAKVQSFLHQKLHFPPYITNLEISESAAYAVSAIRPSGNVLVSLVTNRLYDLNSTNRAIAVYLLGCVGPAADTVLPALMPFLSSTNPLASSAAYAVSRLGPAGAPAVPELIEMMRNAKPGAVYAYNSCLALGSMGAAASNAIPLLRERFAVETNTWLRILLAQALCKIDAGQTEALDFFLDRVQNPVDATERNIVYRYLGNIGPNARRAVPVLEEMLKREPVLIWTSAAEALLKIGESNPVFASVDKRLASETAQTRIEAALFIIPYQPTNQAALTNLIAFMHDPHQGAKITDQLCRIRPVPPLAVPALREIATNRHRAEWRRAVKALESLKAEELEKAKSH